MNMTGNTILVTGGTSGIGRSLAEALHDRGNRVIVTGRRGDLLGAVAAVRPGITGYVMDVTDPQAISRVAGQVSEHFPDLNMLVVNAGISAREDYAGGRLGRLNGGGVDCHQHHGAVANGRGILADAQAPARRRSAGRGRPVRSQRRARGTLRSSVRGSQPHLSTEATLVLLEIRLIFLAR
jgi:NAD(P)-dependent dehydrogenase (short-subunit alcohol dehydrogenase family)